MKREKTERSTRTSLNLPPTIVEQARLIALKQHTNISHVVKEFLQRYVKENSAK